MVEQDITLCEMLSKTNVSCAVTSSDSLVEGSSNMVPSGAMAQFTAANRYCMDKPEFKSAKQQAFILQARS